MTSIHFSTYISTFKIWLEKRNTHLNGWGGGGDSREGGDVIGGGGGDGRGGGGVRGGGGDDRGGGEGVLKGSHCRTFLSLKHPHNNDSEIYSKIVWAKPSSVVWYPTLNFQPLCPCWLVFREISQRFLLSFWRELHSERVYPSVTTGYNQICQKMLTLHQV